MQEKYLYKKPEKNADAVTAGICYPYTYKYGMSVLGFLSLFKEMDKNPDVFAQRIFLDSKNMGVSPDKLDIFGFSCVFETDFMQIFKILKKYHIPLKSGGRVKKYPLLFVGGPVVTANPEPFADFFDFLIIGDGENVMNEIIKVYKSSKVRSKEEILKKLAKIKGIYVPSLYEVKYNQNGVESFIPKCFEVPNKIQKRTHVLEKCLYSPIIAKDAFYSDTMFLEVARGCPYSCEFCTARYHNHPFRYANLKNIKKTIRKGYGYAKKIVFIGAMITEHPQFKEICEYISELQEKKPLELEFSSLSVKKFCSEVPKLLASQQKEISIAIEAGSEKLRNQIKKELTDKEIFDIVSQYKEAGIEKINIYTMIGLPQEGFADIEEFVKLATELKKAHSELEIVYIMSSFIPKPSTPFECEKRESNAALKTKIDFIKTNFEALNIQAKYPMLKYDFANTLISKGDRRLGAFLEHVFIKNIQVKDWAKAYKRFLIKNKELPHYSKYVYKKNNKNEVLPWSFIEF